jgi:alanine dehydrogenase
MISFDDARIVGAAEVHGLLAALAAAFRDPASTPTRSHYDLPGGKDAKLLVMPSWSGDLIGVKVITVIPANGVRGASTVNGLYILLDGQTGSPVATFSGRSLTAVRTAGVCALATSLLARPDARVLLMIGTGYLAPFLIDAYRAVRSLERIVIWGRDPAKAQALAVRLGALPAQVEVARDLAGALGGADIISSATLSREPLVRGDLVSPGTHIDLVGSFTPAMREADSELFRRGHLAVDSATAFEESGDLLAPVREGVIAASAPALTDLLRDPSLGRHSNGSVTVFKSVGTGLADLATARYLLQHAV